MLKKVKKKALWFVKKKKFLHKTDIFKHLFNSRRFLTFFMCKEKYAQNMQGLHCTVNTGSRGCRGYSGSTVCTVQVVHNV